MMTSQRDITYLQYLRRHWKGYLILAALVVISIILGRIQPGGLSEQLFYGFAVGVTSLLVFQVFADYKNLWLIAEILDQHQLSFHLGARLHESHEDLIPRSEALRLFLRKGDVFRLLTSTADDYLITDKEAYRAFIEKLKGGVHVQILLFTPVFHLHSFLDSRMPSPADKAAESTNADHVSHGQRHRHASTLISEHVTTIIPAIENLQKRFSNRIEARFFHVKHHVNMALYGDKRIYAAPLLSGTEGRALPCLEVFPGYASTELFDKLSTEFQYIWNKKSLWFSMDHMKNIYQHISEVAPNYLQAQWIEVAIAGQIAEYARTVSQPSTVDDPPGVTGRRGQSTAPPYGAAI